MLMLENSVQQMLDLHRLFTYKVMMVVMKADRSLKILGHDIFLAHTQSLYIRTCSAEIHAS